MSASFFCFIICTSSLTIAYVELCTGPWCVSVILLATLFFMMLFSLVSFLNLPRILQFYHRPWIFTPRNQQQFYFFLHVSLVLQEYYYFILNTQHFLHLCIAGSSLWFSSSYGALTCFISWMCHRVGFPLLLKNGTKNNPREKIYITGKVASIGVIHESYFPSVQSIIN